MTIQEWLSAWSFDAVPTLAALVVGALYASAWRRVPARPGRPRSAVPPSRAVCFLAGLAALLVAVDGPPDVFAELSFSLHMVQHLLLQVVAAPLLLLGGPVTVILRADPWWCPRRVLVRLLRSRVTVVLTNPVTALAGFTLVLVGTHLTGLYELSLRHEPVHELEHVVYLASALLFWWPAIGVDPAPHRIRHAGRVMYLMLSMPVPALLGAAIAGAGGVMYASYHQPTPWGTDPLADQQAAGTLMWVGGMFTIVPALGVVVMRWLEDEARRGDRRDRNAPTTSDGIAGAR